MENEVTERTALGRVACLGDLYDARSDNFCGLSIFKKAIPKTTLTSTDSHFSNIQFIHSDDFSEKFSKLEVKADLSASVLAGMFSLQGSGRYLKDQKTSARTVKSSLIYNVKTKDEQINLYHEDLKEAFAIEAIESGKATHVVTKISWGANSVLSCFYENRENRNVKEIEGSLSAHMKLAFLNIKGGGKPDIKNKESTSGLKFDIRVYGDILPKNEELPTTFEDALVLMKQLPKLVASSNGGKGKPLLYRLVPISLLKDYLNFTFKVDTIIKSIEEASLTRVVHIFDKLAKVQQQLNDFHQDALDFKVCVCADDLSQISHIKEAMTTQEAWLRSKLLILLTEIRSGKKDTFELENLISEFQNHEWSPLKVSTLLTTWESLIEKISLARTLIQNGVTYVGLGISFDDEILKNFEAKVIILYFTQESKTKNSDRWKGNQQLFCQVVKKNENECRYFAVDCDIHPDLMPLAHTSCIQVLQAGRVLTEDLLEEHEKMAEFSWTQSVIPAERTRYVPNKSVPLTIRCTGKTCNPTTLHDWWCRKCGQEVEYGFDQFVYCGCGKTPVDNLEFKCSDIKHGMEFQRHDEGYFKELLDEIRPFREMNILILGETGVGKSTWINGFVNFLTYNALEEAEAGDLCTLIPSEFTVCDENYEVITVSTGKDKNEKHDTGQSATQDSRVYPFQYGNTKIRLIDTPGIGDTRGVDQDKKNFQNILATLSYFDEIHGICVLLKPNSSRLTLMFRFCIMELLTYLHRDASKNIVFCFTNSRGTFYKPGETMPSLQKLLGENKDVEITIGKKTVYCFDSEAYRFLAAVKNDPPIIFDQSDRANFATSWEKSIAETSRMLAHIRSLKPHPIKSTLNLNTARELVLSLTRPLAEITRNIQTNKEILEQTREMIENTDAEIGKLKNLLMTKMTVLKLHKVDRPKTVCTNRECLKIWTVKGVELRQYVKICHSPCILKGVAADTLGSPLLLDCYAFCNRNECYECGHDYREHLHCYYDSTEEVIEVEDEAVKIALTRGLTGKEMKNNMIKDKNDKIKALEKEQMKIEASSAKFACFLKNNAITPYNDKMEDFLLQSIRDEENSVGLNEPSVKLQGLRLSLGSYKEQKRILETAMATGDQVSVLTPEEIEQVVNELKGLKAGESLQRALDCVDRTKEVVYTEIVLSQAKPIKPQKKGMMSTIWGTVFSWAY